MKTTNLAYLSNFIKYWLPRKHSTNDWSQKNDHLFFVDQARSFDTD